MTENWIVSWTPFLQESQVHQRGREGHSWGGSSTRCLISTCHHTSVGALSEPRWSSAVHGICHSITGIYPTDKASSAYMGPQVKSSTQENIWLCFKHGFEHRQSISPLWTAPLLRISSASPCITRFQPSGFFHSLGSAHSYVCHLVPGTPGTQIIILIKRKTHGRLPWTVCITFKHQCFSSMSSAAPVLSLCHLNHLAF